MLACLTHHTPAVEGLAQVGAGGVIATTKTAALGGGAKDRDVPKSQAVIARVGGSVLSPEPTNTVASADAETGQTQSSISGRALFDGELNGISKNFTLRLVRPVHQKHRAHQAQIAVLDASLRTHFVRTRTLPVRAPTPSILHLLSTLDFC